MQDETRQRWVLSDNLEPLWSKHKANIPASLSMEPGCTGAC